MKKIDLFKLSIVILFTILIVILFRYSQIFSEYSQNGRYILSNEGGAIIDTRNGTIYTLPDNEKINSALPK